MLDSDYIQTHLNSGESLRELCHRNQWSYFNTYYWCRKNGVLLSRQNNGKSTTTLAARKAKIKISSNSDINKMKIMYIDQNKSVHDIAQVFNTTRTTIASSLRRAGVAVKLKNGEYQKRCPVHARQILWALYVEQELSTYEIVSMLGYSNHGCVVEDLKFYNIPRRSYKDAGRILYIKHPEKKELHRQQWYQGIIGPRSINISCLEKTFIDWANNNNVEVIFQFQIRSTWHRYDFLLKGTQIIVEMDGDFWHSLPEHVERDAKFDDTASRYGYTVIRIRESQIKKHPNILDEQLLPLLRGGTICYNEVAF